MKLFQEERGKCTIESYLNGRCGEGIIVFKVKSKPKIECTQNYHLKC